MRNADTPQREISITMRSEVVENYLRIEYTVCNRSDKTLLTYDGAPGEEGQDWPNLAGEVYTSFVLPNVVSIKRIRSPLPRDGEVTFVDVPPVFRLEAGRSRTVRLQLVVPLVERSEWSPDFEGAKYEMQKTEKLELVIGYFQQEQGTCLRPLRKAPDVFLASGILGAQMFAAATGQQHLVVKVRTDALFERF